MKLSIMILCADPMDNDFLNYSIKVLDILFSEYTNLVYLVCITNYG